MEITVLPKENESYGVVAVLCHPSMRKLAEKIVEKANLQETTRSFRSPSGAKVDFVCER